MVEEMPSWPMAPLPLLRAPPFPGLVVELSRTGPSTAATDEAVDIDALFSTIRDARVGGRFWAKPIHLADHRIVVRMRSVIERDAIQARLDSADQKAILWVLPDDDVDPWTVLTPGAELLAYGDDEWVALAHIAGCAVKILSVGAHRVAEMDPVEARACTARALLDVRYRDPFTGQDITIDEAIAHLTVWRRMIEANRDIVAACGIAWWKRHEVVRFLWKPGQGLRFFQSERRAIAHAAKLGGAIAVWPSRISAAMADRAAAAGVPLIRVEDGFVRSIGLGSDMVPPSSITVDRQGIHYDPARPSDLETLLAKTRFSPALLTRARHLRASIVAGGISKYGGQGDHVFPHRSPGRRLVLVPGQVEDDMSVRLGGAGLASNLDLLRRVRALEPEAEIWFRPHPDVDAGHRKGAVRDDDALTVADRVVRGGGMAKLLELVDAVHVLTSLTGFEALMRGRDVTCHGIPFYAGWGLTEDLAPVPDRRGRTLTLDQLVAGVLILYPRYLDPVTGLPCDPEVLLRRMVAGKAVNRLEWITRIRRTQGWLTKSWR
jgi:capsular polysaccharide export protein